MINKENINNHPVFLGFLSGGKSVGRYFENVEDLRLDSGVAYAHQLNDRFYAKGLKVCAKYMYLSIKKSFGDHYAFKAGNVEVYLSGESFLSGVGVFDEFAHSITLYDVDSKECVEYHFSDALWNEMVVIQDEE